MLKFLPILLMLAYGFAMYRFSVWRTTKMLDQQSRPLDEPGIKALTDRMAAALDLPPPLASPAARRPPGGAATPLHLLPLTRPPTPARNTPPANSASLPHPLAALTASNKQAHGVDQSIHTHFQASSAARGGQQSTTRPGDVGWRQLAFKGATHGPETPWLRTGPART